MRKIKLFILYFTLVIVLFFLIIDFYFVYLDFSGQKGKANNISNMIMSKIDGRKNKK
jgi:hypothetical protein